MCKHKIFFFFFLQLHLLHADWDRDPPSLPFKSHKTINLTSTDHPILLGSPEANAAKSSLDFTTRISTETLATKADPARPVVVSDPQSPLVDSGLIDFIQVLFTAQGLFNEFTPCHVSLQDVASNGVNGGFREEPVTMRNKGKEQSSQKGYEIDLDDYFWSEYKNTSVGVSIC